MQQHTRVGLDRITSTDTRALLDRIAGTNLVQRGAVTVVSVDSIRVRTSERWARKRADVWAYVERKCDEHLSFQDIRHRIAETDFLIAMTTEEGIAAQAISLKILEEVLIFFLGVLEPGDIKVSAVTAIEGDVITSCEIDLAKLAAARQRPSEPYAHGVDPSETGRRSPVSFVTATGERVRIDFGLEQVVNLAHSVTSALRVQPHVRTVATGVPIPTSAFAKLADEDIAFIDRATFEFGSLFMPKDVTSDPPLILPASFRTMGARKGRSALIGMGGTARERVRYGVMVELVDIDLGTPTSRLAEVTSLVGQLCRGVVTRIWPMRDPFQPIRGARVNGIALDVRGLPMDEARLTAFLRQIALLGRGKAPALIAQGLADATWLPRMHACGFTHAALAAPPLTQNPGAVEP